MRVSERLVTRFSFVIYEMYALLNRRVRGRCHACVRPSVKIIVPNINGFYLLVEPSRRWSLSRKQIPGRGPDHVKTLSDFANLKMITRCKDFVRLLRTCLQKDRVGSVRHNRTEEWAGASPFTT